MTSNFANFLSFAVIGSMVYQIIFYAYLPLTTCYQTLVIFTFFKLKTSMILPEDTRISMTKAMAGVMVMKILGWYGVSMSFLGILSLITGFSTMTLMVAMFLPDTFLSSKNCEIDYFFSCKLFLKHIAD